MKQFLSLVAAGAIGAVLTFGIVRLGDQTFAPEKQAVDTHIHPAGINNAMLEVKNPENAVDFTYAAEIAMDAVVLVEAKESDELAQRRRQEQQQRNPWNRFFDFDFGDDFFNMPFGFGFPPRKGSGSGVIISDDGYIITNNHVVDFADKVHVRTNDGQEFNAIIIGRDPSSDLAVLKVDGKNLPTLEFGDSDKAKVGEWVLAVGNPFEYLTSTVTAGIISAKGRDINLLRGEKTIEEFIQTDAAINPGNSGGALVDSRGRLIGINTAIASQTGNYAGYSFAIPINLASRIVNDIIENGGVIERTHLGVVVEELDTEYASQLGIGVSEGLIVREVVDGSAAQFAGVLPDDVILSVNGKEMTEFEDLKKIVDYAKVGDTLELLLYREGKEVTLPVRLRKRI